MISNDMEDPNNQKPEGDEEWEGEVPEYMKKRIDQIVEQIQKAKNIKQIHRKPKMPQNVQLCCGVGRVAAYSACAS